MLKLTNLLRDMGHSRVKNYIVPDVTSMLVGSDDGSQGRVRIFDSRRDQDMLVTPHSHRFDLWSYVVEGSVENTIYAQARVGETGDMYKKVYQKFGGEIGEFEVSSEMPKQRYNKFVNTYNRGDSYFMEYDQIHTIKFSRDTVLLIIEGKPKSSNNAVLFPVTNDDTVINTLTTEEWMFRRE